MGPPLFFSKALYKGQTPDISLIAAKVEKLSGLAVRIRQPETSALSDAYDVNGFIAFACAPDGEIELCAFNVTAVLKNSALREDVEFLLPFPRNVRKWLNEPEGKQAVHLRVWGDALLAIALDETFQTYVLLALEALGGELTEPPTEEERRLCAAPITELELEYRYWKAHGKRLLGVFVSGFTEPFYVICELFGAIFPRRRLEQAAPENAELHDLSGKTTQARAALPIWLRIALFPFRAVGSTVISVIIAVGAPITGLYLLLQFAGKTVRLAYHMLAQRARSPS